MAGSDRWSGATAGQPPSAGQSHAPWLRAGFRDSPVYVAVPLRSSESGSRDVLGIIHPTGLRLVLDAADVANDRLISVIPCRAREAPGISFLWCISRS